MIKHQIFVNNHLSVQAQPNKNVSKGYSVCSNSGKKILFQDSSVAVITFRYDVTFHLGAFTVYSTCQTV